MSIDIPTIRVRVGSDSHDEPVFPEAERQSFQELQNAYTPPIDIHEGPEGLTLEADLPGATERNLRIQLEDNVLSLYAKIDSPVPEGARLVHEEYRLGDYHRSFILSDEVDREQITA
jgi:HSP20 family protein